MESLEDLVIVPPGLVKVMSLLYAISVWSLLINVRSVKNWHVENILFLLSFDYLRFFKSINITLQCEQSSVFLVDLAIQLEILCFTNFLFCKICLILFFFCLGLLDHFVLGM